MAAFSTVALTELKSITHLGLEDFPFVSLTFLPMPTLESLCIDRWTNLQEVGEFTTIRRISIKNHNDATWLSLI